MIRPMYNITSQEIETKNREFETATPQQILQWAIPRFTPGIGMTSSFGADACALIHMATRVDPNLPIYFIDTLYHFKQTIAYKERLRELYDLNIIDVRPTMPRDRFIAEYGDDLNQRDPDKCCEINKVEPFQKAIASLKVWITGIRREQSKTRADAKFVEIYSDGPIKINPLLNWTKKEVWKYILANKIPYNPLADAGYKSIGCEPCTRPVGEGEDERAGRWAGKEKTECGLHTLMHREN